jgi:hypothetical protein
VEPGTKELHTTAGATTNSNIPSQEIATLVLGLIDVGGVWFALSRASGTNDIKLLSIGLGWAIANNTAAYGPELWINSRTLQFSWTHIQNSIDSNIMLVRSNRL